MDGDSELGLAKSHRGIREGHGFSRAEFGAIQKGASAPEVHS